MAAFILDSKGVHGVPETFFVEVKHPFFGGARNQELGCSERNTEMLPVSYDSFSGLGVKFGSLQFLKENDGESCDFPCRKYSVEEVQAIAALDFRILNCDRNEGNILVKKVDNDKLHLIPIDHALSFPDSLSICDYELCWSLWPQLEQPVNEKQHEYICQLDTKSNIHILKKFVTLRPVPSFSLRCASVITA